MGLSNSQWSSTYIKSIAHLHRNCSNHAPLLVSVSNPNASGYAFRHLNVWEKHHGFMKIVENCWAQPRGGEAIGEICTKIEGPETDPKGME